MFAVNETRKGWVSAQHLLGVVHGTSLGPFHYCIGVILFVSFYFSFQN